jgi:hypothetical protein
MSTVLPDVRSVVEALGGISKTAERFGVVYGAVHNWTTKNTLPAYTAFEIKPLLKRKRLSAPDALWTRRSPSVSRRKSAALSPSEKEVIA